MTIRRLLKWLLFANALAFAASAVFWTLSYVAPFDNITNGGGLINYRGGLIVIFRCDALRQRSGNVWGTESNWLYLTNGGGNAKVEFRALLSMEILAAAIIAGLLRLTQRTRVRGFSVLSVCSGSSRADQFKMPPAQRQMEAQR